jgi:two-component system, LytTR family, response regulator
MINAIIIDDELQGRKLLQALIKSHCPEINVVEECADLPNGVKAIRKHKPNLIFLDIEMPEHSGLELLDFFDEKDIDFGIIFTTAYNEYAVKAFKMSAVDYLLKPISGGDLEQAIERFQKRFAKSDLSKTKPENQFIPIEKAENKIAIPVGQSIKFIDLDEIVYLKAENTYTEIHLQDQSKLLVSRTLKNFEEVLVDKHIFFRCHKSYIINRQFVLDYVKSDGGYLVLKPSIEIPISSEKVQVFLDKSVVVKR